MSKFLSYILNLRGAAIFIVVGVHARGNTSDWTNNLNVHDFLSTFFDAREGSGTVMFIFIGGFLFQYITHNNFDFRKYLEKKFMYVILPYLLISIPIIAYRIYTDYSFALPAGFNDQSMFYRFFYYIFTGLHLAPFWFISAIVFFYLTAPLFHALDNRTAYRYLFPLIFITCFFTYRSAHNANPFLSYIHYFPIYYLGMWTSFNRTKILAAGDWLLYLLIFVYAAMAISNLTGWLPLAERISFEEILTNRLLIFNLDMLKALLLCFLLMLLLYKFRERRVLFLEVLGEYSFGIFFVHCIFIYSTRKIWVDVFGPMDFSLLSFLIYFSFILLISTVTVYFIKKMTGRYSRILIGS
jgi:probable poly-beta-1,6-N-acetyl-D-glucosamine export protein